MNRFSTILAVALAAGPGLAGVSARGQAAPSPEPVLQRLTVSSGGASVTMEAPLPARAAALAEVRAIDPFPAPVLVPDVYPSKANAARGLGETWAVKVAEEGPTPPATVRVFCCDATVYASLREGILSQLPGVRVDKAAPDECPDGFHGVPASGQAWLLLEAKETRVVFADNPRARRSERGPEPGGTLTLTARGATAAAAVASFVDKPWVSDFAVFTHQRPGRWVVGRSDPLKPALDPAEAAEAAHRAAAEELLPVVRARLRRAGRPDPGEGWVRQRLDAKLVGGDLVVDRFPQRFQRPGFDTWREAVLIDASDRTLDRLVGDLHAERFQERQSWIKTVASAGGLLLVIYTLYRLANAFTRGYFVWSLRTAAAVAATAVVVLISVIA